MRVWLLLLVNEVFEGLFVSVRCCYAETVAAQVCSDRRTLLPVSLYLSL